jgi:DNA polymerase IV
MKPQNIINLNIPDFYAALEEIRRPELKKSVLVLAEPGTRLVIQGVNRIARKEGISAGMSMSQARRICRRMIAIPSDLYHYAL